MVRWRVPTVALGVLAGAVAACELEEVTIPSGDPVVVVHAVMRPDRSQQFVVVERSFSGEVDPDEFAGQTIPSTTSPQIPVVGARVEVRNLDWVGNPCGDSTIFTTVAEDPTLFRLPGVYWGPPNCPAMRPGDRLALRVETAAGEVITGSARVPGMNGATLTVAGETVGFGTADTTRFNRDRDTLRIAIDPIVGRLMQVEARRIGDESAAAGSKLFADSTMVALPGDLPDFLPGGGGEDIFRGGRRYVLSAALADVNYFDFARSRNNPLTGRGFINRLDGGIGVFGSLTALTTVVEAESDVDDAREGVYRLTGSLEGITIDAMLTLYLARSVDSTEVSVFMSGQWLMGVRSSAGLVWVSRSLNRLSADGLANGNRLEIEVPGPGGWSDVVGALVIATTVSSVPTSSAMVVDSLELGGARTLGEISIEKQ